MGTQEVESPVSDNEEPWFVSRPPEVLMDLPYGVRWEVTRRHPYYLRCWEPAQRFYTTPSTDAEQRDRERLAALVLLATLGITSAPPPPGSGADSLGAGNLSKAWESGAAAPITLRGLAALLLTDLPGDALAQVGLLLVQCGTQAEQKHEKLPYLQELLSLPYPALDGLPNRAVVGVNVQAPLRTITETIEKMVRQWKEQQGIGERRRRDDKLKEYLDIWDRREGWVVDRYDGSKEQTLRAVAQELHIPLSTVANRYRSAFRLIVGHDYTPALWARVIGIIKVDEWLDPDELPRRTLHRPWRERQRRAVPEAALQATGEGAGASGGLNALGVSPDEVVYRDLVLDIQELLARGRSNSEIVAALELTSSAAEDLIECLRQRQQDQL
jgi:hypothetical protein